MSDDRAEKLAANRKAREERKTTYLRRIADRHAEAFRAAAGRNGASVAMEAHGAMDSVLQRDREKDPASGGIRCSKGCSHCCHGPVEIWPQEAALLIKAALDAGIDLDRPRL